MQDSKGDTDVKNRPVDSVGEGEGGMIWENSIETCISKVKKWKWSHSVMSDSLQPHGLQPTRLLRPWDFSGNSTGVGCHFLPIYEIDDQSKFDAWPRALKAGALGQPRGKGWGGRWEGVWEGGHMYTRGWFMSMCGKNHHNIVISLQLK